MSSNSASTSDHPFSDKRWDALPLYRWWRMAVVGTVDHEKIVSQVVEDSGWSPRYGFMTMMSAGIAVLGLLLSSPAVVIGAMLISPLMSPILALGFSLALFDFAEMRRALVALAIGAGAAILFTALIVLASPLKAPTAEILARTRPNLFDLLVALFSALAGTFAIIRGRGETIVGVAIATALMPPLAVVGYGLATWNMPVLGGALALFITNFVTIALAATIMARLYGFGHFLSSQQSWTQTWLLLFVFIVMAVPLGISLSRIAGEAVTANQVRSFLSDRFGTNARVTQLDIDFDQNPIVVRSVVIAPRSMSKNNGALQTDLAARLNQPVKLQVDQVLLDPGAGALDVQRAELREATEAASAARKLENAIAGMVALAAGVSPDDVTLDKEHRRATAAATALPGASLATYYALEQRISGEASGWQIAIVPPPLPLPEIGFANGDAEVDASARQAVIISAWAARRWNIPDVGVPGLPAADRTNGVRPLSVRRAMNIAELLRQQGVRPAPSPATGQNFRLLAARAE